MNDNILIMINIKYIQKPDFMSYFQRYQTTFGFCLKQEKAIWNFVFFYLNEIIFLTPKQTANSILVLFKKHHKMLLDVSESNTF